MIVHLSVLWKRTVLLPYFYFWVDVDHKPGLLLWTAGSVDHMWSGRTVEVPPSYYPAAAVAWHTS